MVLTASPLAVKPPPETVTAEMVTLEFPVFVSVTVCVGVLPSTTLPKLRAVELAESTLVGAIPVPLIVIVAGLVGALLTTEILPVTELVVVGANRALKVVL